MPPDGEGQRGFFRSPVTFIIAFAILIAGVLLALWDVWIPSPFNWLHWRQWGGIALVVLALFCLRRVKPLPQGTELERCRRSRTAFLALAVVYLVCALFLGWVAWSLWRVAPPGGAMRPVAYASACAAIPVAISGLMLWLYRREGRKLRRLQGRCEQCGYDLRGLPEPRCPECGTPFTPGNTAQ